MEKNKLLSVVLPTWNREWCLSDAIRSVRGQTYQDWELIVIDDGSTDGTKDLMSFWCSEDRRIKYFRREENKGIAFSRNEGIQEATGDIIVVMDSDDLMIDKRLELIAQAFEKENCDVLYSDFYRGDQMGNAVSIIRAQDFSDELLDGRQEMGHLTMACTREIALRVPYQDDKRINDDWFWCVDLYNAGARFYHLAEPTMIERSFGSGVSRQSREQYDKDFQEYKINPELRKQNGKNT